MKYNKWFQIDIKMYPSEKAELRMFLLAHSVTEVKIRTGMGCLETLKFIEIFLRRAYHGMEYGKWWETNILGSSIPNQIFEFPLIYHTLM